MIDTGAQRLANLEELVWLALARQAGSGGGGSTVTLPATALSATLPSGEYATVFVDGYTEPGDGGANTFSFIRTSTYRPDQGTFFEITALRIALSGEFTTTAGSNLIAATVSQIGAIVAGSWLLFSNADILTNGIPRWYRVSSLSSDGLTLTMERGFVGVTGTVTTGVTAATPGGGWLNNGFDGHNLYSRYFPFVADGATDDYGWLQYMLDLCELEQPYEVVMCALPNRAFGGMPDATPVTAYATGMTLRKNNATGNPLNDGNACRILRGEVTTQGNIAVAILNCQDAEHVITSDLILEGVPGGSSYSTVTYRGTVVNCLVPSRNGSAWEPYINFSERQQSDLSGATSWSIEYLFDPLTMRPGLGIGTSFELGAIGGVLHGFSAGTVARAWNFMIDNDRSISSIITTSAGSVTLQSAANVLPASTPQKIYFCFDGIANEYSISVEGVVVASHALAPSAKILQYWWHEFTLGKGIATYFRGTDSVFGSSDSWLLGLVDVCTGKIRHAATYTPTPTLPPSDVNTLVMIDFAPENIPPYGSMQSYIIGRSGTGPPGKNGYPIYLNMHNYNVPYVVGGEVSYLYLFNTQGSALSMWASLNSKTRQCKITSYNGILFNYYSYGAIVEDLYFYGCRPASPNCQSACLFFDNGSQFTEFRGKIQTNSCTNNWAIQNIFSSIEIGATFIGSHNVGGIAMWGATDDAFIHNMTIDDESGSMGKTTAGAGIYFAGNSLDVISGWLSCGNATSYLLAAYKHMRTSATTYGTTQPIFAGDPAAPSTIPAEWDGFDLSGTSPIIDLTRPIPVIVPRREVFGVGDVVAPSSSTVVLTQNQMLDGEIELSDGGNGAVIFQAPFNIAGYRRVIRAKSTNANPVNFGGAAGGQIVEIVAGTSRIVHCTGTDWIQDLP